MSHLLLTFEISFLSKMYMFTDFIVYFFYSQKVSIWILQVLRCRFSHFKSRYSTSFVFINLSNTEHTQSHFLLSLPTIRVRRWVGLPFLFQLRNVAWDSEMPIFIPTTSCELELTCWWSQKNHIIKRRGMSPRPQNPKPSTGWLRLEIQNWWQRAALVEPVHVIAMQVKLSQQFYRLRGRDTPRGAVMCPK